MHLHDCQGMPPIPRPALKDHPAERDLLRSLISGMGHPDDPVEHLAVGQRFVAVAAGGRLGLASTLGAGAVDGHQEALSKAGRSSLAEVAELLLQDDPLLASLGLAALNAGMEVPAAASELGAEELLLGRCVGKRVVVVGDFPFVAKLAQEAAEVQVLELRPGAAGLTREAWEAALGACEVAAITGTALLTRAMARLVEATAGAYQVIIGPSTPWAGLLLELGVDVLAGPRVTDVGNVMQAVAQGLPFHQVKRYGVTSLSWLREDRG